MFLRSLALINSVDHPDTLLPSKALPSRSKPAATPPTSDRCAHWSHAAVAAELVSLTRLFKRLMRSRSRSSAPSQAENAASRQWQTTVASVRHALPTDTQQRADSARSRIHGCDRIPAMLRKAQATRRLSPVQVGNFASPIAAPAAHPRVHADPVDPQRLVISGSFAEVCAMLDRLVDKQEAGLAQQSGR